MAIPDLTVFFLAFSVLGIALHRLLVYRMQLGSTAWKYVDYVWFIPAVAGIVLAYYSIVDRDLRRDLQSATSGLDVQVDSLVDYLVEHGRFSCDLTTPEILPEQPRHPMVLAPPDQDLLVQEEPTHPTDAALRCSAATNIERLLRYWRSAEGWPGPVQLDLQHTQYARSFPEIRDQIGLTIYKASSIATSARIPSWLSRVFFCLIWIAWSTI
jgi:hypothetical protein